MKILLIKETKMKKQNVMEEYSKRMEKYMRSLWGLSDDDDYDNNDIESLNNDENYKKAKLEHNSDEVKNMELNKKQPKKNQLDIQRDELVKTKEASFGKNMLKRTELNEMKELDVKKHRKKKRRKNKKMTTSKINSTRENCVSENESENENEIEMEVKMETETIKGNEDIQINLPKSGSKNINKNERKNTYKEKKESSIFRDTKLEKQEHLKDKFGTISNIQDELIIKGYTNIMSTMKENEKKIGKGREKKANVKKSITKNNKLNNKETTDIRNIIKEERAEFKNIVREVRNVAKQHLSKFQKLILLNHEIKELGGKFDKSRKMPYPELICRKRAMKRYIKERKEMERYAGVKFQSGDYTDMQDVFRKKKKERKKKRQHSSKLFGI